MADPITDLLTEINKILELVEEIGRAMNGYEMIVNKSTVSGRRRHPSR